MATVSDPDYTNEELAQDVADLRAKVDALEEILQMFDGPVPNAPPSSGFDFFSSNGQPNYLNVSGLQMGISGAQGATFPGTTVTATSLTNICTATIPANDADVGAVYELEVWGDGSQPATRQTLSIAPALGGTVVSPTLTFGTIAFVASTTFRFYARAILACVTIGSGATWRGSIMAITNVENQNLAPGNNNMAAGIDTRAGTTDTVSSIVSNTFSIQVAFGGTGCSITSETALFRRTA